MLFLKHLTLIFCIPAIFLVSFSPMALAKVTADQCVNGLSQAQIDRLYEINVQESRINEMCKDSALNPAKLDELIAPHKVPSLEEINKCIADVNALFTEFDDLIAKGFDVAQGAATFEDQCKTIVSPAQVADCINQANVLFAKSQDLRDQGIIFKDKPAPVQKQCEEALTKGSASVPESLVRRILDNNKASDILNTDWKKALADWQDTGKLPDGITPYYPEEREALKMLGLTDEDLQYVPPRNFAEAAEDFAVEQLNKGLDKAVPTVAGLGMHVLLILGWAIGSPFHLIGCASRASVLLYIAGSLTYIGLEIALAFEYKDLIDRITKLISDGKKSAQVTLDDVEALQDDANAIASDGKAFSTEVKDLYNTCKNLVEQAKASGSGVTGCLPSVPGLPGGGSGSGGDTQQCIDDAQTSYNDLSGKIHDCMNRAQSAGLTAADLQAKGLAFLDNVEKAGQGAVNQLKMLKYVRETMQKVTDIINDKSRNVFIYAGVLTGAAAIAMAEVFSNWWVLGACTGDAGPPPHLSVPGKYAGILSLFPEVFAQEGDSGSGSGQQSSKKFKKFNQKEVEEKIDKMIGRDAVSLIVGLAIGLLVTIVMQILVAVLSGKASGIMRSIFLAAGAAIGFTTGGLLTSAGNLMQSYTDKVTLVIKAMERTMSNQGWIDDGTPWDGPVNPESYWDQGVEIINKFTALGNEIMSIPMAHAASIRQNCLAGGDSVIKLDKNCSCAAQGSCKQVNLPKEIPMPKEISSNAFRYQSATITNMKHYAQSVANGDKQAAVSYGSRIIASKKGLESEMGLMQKAVNLKLAKNKSTPLNFSRETEQMKNDITSRVQRTFNTFPADIRNSYLKRTEGIATPPAMANQAVDSRNQRLRPTIAKLKDFFKSLGPLGQRKFFKKHDRTADRLSARGAAVTLGMPQDADSGEDNSEELDISMDDIIMDPAASIFEMIHQRYIKQSLP